MSFIWRHLIGLPLLRGSRNETPRQCWTRLSGMKWICMLRSRRSYLCPYCTVRAVLWLFLQHPVGIEWFISTLTRNTVIHVVTDKGKVLAECITLWVISALFPNFPVICIVLLYVSYVCSCLSLGGMLHVIEILWRQDVPSFICRTRIHISYAFPRTAGFLLCHQ